MKGKEFIVLGLAGVALLLIVKSAGRATTGGAGTVAGYGNAGSAYDAQVWRDRANMTPAQFSAKYGGWSGGDWM